MHLLSNERCCPRTYASKSNCEMDELRHLVFNWCCIAHSCSRARKWCLRGLVLSEDMLVDVKVSMSSLLRATGGDGSNNTLQKTVEIKQHDGVYNLGAKLASCLKEKRIETLT